MTRTLLIFVAAVYFVPAAGMPLNAQNAPSAQSSDSSQGAIQASTPPAAAPSGKKVWTNDDVSGLRHDAGISSIGSNSASARSTRTVAQASKRNTAAWYSDQISKLQAQIPPVDAQIAELQAAIDGKPTGDAKKSVRPYSVRADDWSAELAQLSKKRDDISGKIAEVRDHARRSGIPANALP